jgi:putative inorganic carbon (hco3(-)) transporter
MTTIMPSAWSHRPSAFGIAAALVAVGAAVYSGMSWGTGQKMAVVIPLVLVVALMLGVLALTRFAAFVYLVLGVRASIDLFKLSGASAGNTVTNTSAARGLDPSSILGVMFLLAAALWLVAQYHNDGRIRGSRVRLALVSLCVAGTISVLGSEERLVSILEVLRISSVVMMYVVLEQLITSRRAMYQVLAAAYASMLFPLVYTMVLFGFGSPPAEVKGSFTRITGPFSQSTTFGRYLAFMIVFGVAVLPYLGRRAKVAMGATLTVSSVFLLLTLTRGALVGAIAGLLVVMVVQRRKGMMIGFVTAGLVALMVVPGLLGRFSEVADTRAVGGAPTGNTLAWRLDYWTQVLPLANSNPITGIGLNMTQYNTSDAKQPHNDFIRAYVETGVIGLGAYLAVLWSLLAMGRQAVRRAAAGSIEKAVAVGYLGCAVAFVVQSAGANVMSNVVCLWYLVAFAAAASYVARRAGPEPTVPEPAPLHLSKQ